MTAQIAFGLIVLFLSYAGTAFLLIEILMWVMRRLDNPRVSPKSAISVVEYQFESGISVQADLARTYLFEDYMMSNIELEADHQQNEPFSDGVPYVIPLPESAISFHFPHIQSD